jgi:hypothetical protein
MIGNSQLDMVKNAFYFSPSTMEVGNDSTQLEIFYGISSPLAMTCLASKRRKYESIVGGK